MLSLPQLDCAVDWRIPVLDILLVGKKMVREDKSSVPLQWLVGNRGVYGRAAVFSLFGNPAVSSAAVRPTAWVRGRHR